MHTKPALIETIGEHAIWLNDSGRTYYITGPDVRTKDWFHKLSTARAAIAFAQKHPSRRRLYVDDLRPCPDGWDLARNFHEAIVALEAYQYKVVSLDHDIASFYGNKELTGRDILNWLIMRKIEGGYTPPEVRVHSANPVGCATMEQDIKRYWGTP